MSRLSLSLPFAGFDLEYALAPWSWRCPRDYRPVMLTVFGDWVFRAPDAAIHLLDVAHGELVQIAQDSAEFSRLKDLADKREHWFRQSLVLDLARRGTFLGPGECFGFRQAPVLGGAMSLENVETYPVVLYQTMLGQLHEERARQRAVVSD